MKIKRKIISKPYELYLGDCLEKMKDISDSSIDLVVTDLPYGITQCKWDSIIPFDLLWKEWNRVCKGIICLFASQPFTSALIMSNPKDFHYDWVWKKLGKPTNHLNAKRQPMRNKEDILVFWKGNNKTYNPQMSTGLPFKDKAGKDYVSNSSMTESYGAYSNYRNENLGTRYPKQILEFSRVERGLLHPTQKPVELMEYLIKTYSNEGDLVLDNCMGSGTTGVAAISLERKFIGIELDPEYYEVAKKRIDDKWQTGF